MKFKDAKGGDRFKLRGYEYMLIKLSKPAKDENDVKFFALISGPAEPFYNINHDDEIEVWK